MHRYVNSNGFLETNIPKLDYHFHLLKIKLNVFLTRRKVFLVTLNSTTNMVGIDHNGIFTDYSSVKESEKVIERETFNM